MTVSASSTLHASRCAYPNQIPQRRNTISWSALYDARRQIASRFGRVWRLPLRRRWSDVLLQQLDMPMSVLEIGAGARRTAEWLKQHRPKTAYLSMDIDRSLPHDYYDLEEIDRRFSAVLAFEVVEHLTLDEARALLARCHELVEPDGRLLLTTPNTFYPPDFLRDATHRTPFCYDELGAVVTLAGFQVEGIFRLYHDALWRKFVKRFLLGWLFRLIGIDFARQIMLVARKPASAEASARASTPCSAQDEPARPARD